MTDIRLDADALKLRRLRCWLRGRVARLHGTRWNGHCWGQGGRCIDCGSA